MARENLFFTANGASPTTAALVKVSTGTAVATMLQITNSSTQEISVVEWGISFDGSAAATPIECELVHTGAVAGTSMNTGFTSTFSGPNDVGSQVSSVQYWKSAQAEGTITTTRYGDLQLVSPTNQYVKQFPLGREFVVPASGILRVRVTAAAAVNCYCYIVWAE